MSQRSRHKGFRDYGRAMQAVVLAGHYGLMGAAERTGFHVGTISKWRRMIERETCEPLRRARRRPRGNGKLSPAKAQELRQRRRRGVSWGVLARIYKISPTACVKVCKGELYPVGGGA